MAVELLAVDVPRSEPVLESVQLTLAHPAHEQPPVHHPGPLEGHNAVIPTIRRVAPPEPPRKERRLFMGPV